MSLIRLYALASANFKMEYEAMQVLIPISSRSQFFPEAEYYFPKPLIDVDGLPMIERVISNIKEFVDNPKFIFVVDRKDCVKFSLEKLLIILGGQSTVVVQKDFETAGALCSILLAVDYIDLDEPLIISSSGGVRQGVLYFQWFAFAWGSKAPAKQY